MVTSVARQRWASLLASLALVFASGVLVALPAHAEEAPAEAGIGEPAFEEAVPDPETGLYPGQAAPADDFGPGSPGWITGYTQHDANAPAAAPVAPKAATVKSAPRTTTQVRRTSPRAVERASVSRSSSDPALVGGQPTALAFTGSRLENQLAAGAALIGIGWLFLIVSRPRHSGSRRITS